MSTHPPQPRRHLRWPLILVAIGIVLGLALLATPARAGAAPSIASEYPDYNPGQVVALFGAGWDPAGPAVEVAVRAVGDPWAYSTTVVPAPDGSLMVSFSLPPYFVPLLEVEATQEAAAGTLRASTTFTDANPSASLSQCANDPTPSPSTDGCSGAPGQNGWVNGNVNAAKANYFEGDSVPYRAVMSNISLAGTHTLTIEWDTTQSGRHAIDYLTSFDRTVATADPCLDVSGCGSPSTFPIPADPQVTGAGVTPIAGSFTLYGGTITGVSSYSGGASFPAGNNVRSIEITFTASVANPVMAWGGHIATRQDWGAGNSAVAISGSPFHMRLLGLDGQGGNQDRALSADAVTYPGSITITKAAAPEGATSFPFTAGPSPLEDFTLTDDGTASATRTFAGITDFQTYSVAEKVPADWNLDGVKCTVDGGLSTAPPATMTNVLDIALKEGDDVACTFTNTSKGTLTVRKTLAPADDPGLFDLQIDDTTLAAAVGEGGTTGPQIVDAGTHTVAELGANGTDLAAYATTVTCTDGVETLVDAAPVTSTEIEVADGQNVTCTFANVRKGTLTVVKNLIPATDTGTFDLQIDGSTLAAAVGDGGTTGAQIVDAGTFTVGELGANGTSLADYISTVACTDGVDTLVSATGTSATVPVANGQDVVCTFTNTADTGPIIPAGVPDSPAAADIPVVVPPTTVRGAARLRGPRGCVKPGVVLSRVTGRNMARVVFLRNGRVVKRVNLTGTNAAKLRTVALRTRIRPSDFRRYRVVARVTYVSGATPRSKTMTHTFRQCGRSSVTG